MTIFKITSIKIMITNKKPAVNLFSKSKKGVIIRKLVKDRGMA